ncbi:hypothetical protein MR857_08010 [bacterium]|nr:hypothetical protein [bacterium]MDY3020999.1 hypothetical protein [Oliverpabstia sp.]
MEDKILNAMASDMKITKYTTESDSQYCNRILYSAMACWIKTVAADKVLGNNDNSGVSRRHILDRCTPILNELLLRYPVSRSWFLPETNADNPISIIRSRLIRHGDLLNVGFNTNLILANQEIVPTNESFATYRGVLLSPQTYYSGIALLGTALPVDTSRPTMQDNLAWYSEYIQSAWWEKCNSLDENTQFYNASKRSRNNYSCWQSLMPAPTNGVIFARRTVYNAGYEYFLIKEKYGNHYVHRIDPFIQEMGEHRNFMFALRSLSENKIPCQITLHSDYVQLKMWVHLPQDELSLLESYAWPHNSVSDVLEWDMQLNIWSFIRPFLEALGFGIMEA